MCTDCGCGDVNLVPLELQTRILARNDQTASHNRAHLRDRGIFERLLDKADALVRANKMREAATLYSRVATIPLKAKQVELAKERMTQTPRTAEAD